jgi:HEAT repeat protein
MTTLSAFVPRLAVAACLSFAVTLPACNSQGSKPNDTKPGTTQNTPPAGTGGRVQSSILRERAINVVEESFRSEIAEVRANAVQGASFVPQRLKAIIDAGLTDASPGVRGVAALAIGRAGLKGYETSLRTLRNDPEPLVQVSALFALLKTGAEVDRSPLAWYLLDHPNPWVKRQAADSLGQLNDRSALPLLRDAARAKYPSLAPEQVKILQLLIAEAMIRLGDDTPRQALRAALYPSRPEELEAAALAVTIIGEVQDREATSQLVYLSQYRDRTGQQYPAEVRLAVAFSLARLGLPQGAFIADEYVTSLSAAVRAQCALVYAVTKGPDNLEKLDRLLSDPDPIVRSTAAVGVLRAGTGG